MRKIRNIVLGGIQQKVFNLVLITVLLVIAAYTVVILYQAGRITDLVEETSSAQKESISTVSHETMDAVLESNLTQGTQMQAYIANEMFDDSAGVLHILSDYAQKLFSDPASYPARETALPDLSRDGEVSAQILTEEGVDIADPVITEKLGLIGNMADLMTAVYADSNVDSCYVALPEGVMLLVDDHAGSKFDENGNIIPINIRERLWYTGAVETGGLYFTDVTTDLFTGQISIMCSLPVYDNGQLVAVIGADIFLDDMSEAVNSLSRNGGFICIVNQNGHVIFSPQTEGIFQVQNGDELQDLRALDNAELASLITDALSESTELRLVEADGELYYMAGAPIESVGWTILNIVPKELADTPTATLEEQYDTIESEALRSFSDGLAQSKRVIIIFIVVITGMCLGGALTLSKRIVLPLNTITERVRSLSGDNLQFTMERDYRTGDEIEVLAEAFAMISSKTVQYISEVERVTAEKERIGAELSLATRIQADMLPNIFPAFPDRTEFDIFASMNPAREVGGDFYDFFLVDDDHLCMVIADVSGKGVPAALFMMASKILLQNNAMLGKSPAQILTDSNAAICSNNREEMFVTVWIGILELSTGRLRAANAGHEYPVLRKQGGSFEIVRDKHGFVLGGLDSVQYKEYELLLEPGSRLFLYTDGVPEATDADEELFGTDRMLASLNTEPDASPKQILENVRKGVNAFVKDAEQFDDLTMLCMEYRQSGDGSLIDLDRLTDQSDQSGDGSLIGLD